MGQRLSLPPPPPHDATPLPEVDHESLLASDMSLLSFETAEEGETTAEKMGEEVRSTDLTKDHSTSSAATRVFAVFELAEQILQDVRPQDLLLWQQVNSSFRDVFKNSARLQNLLYRPPTKHTPGYRMLAVLPEPVFDWSKDRKDEVLYRPLLEGYLTIRGSCIYEAQDPVDKIDYSWRRLLICQPAIKRVTMWVGGHSEEIRREEGIRIGDLVDAACRYIYPFRQPKWLDRCDFSLHCSTCSGGYTNSPHACGFRATKGASCDRRRA